MNTNFLLTKDYEQITMNNEPIKTNPIKPNQSQTNSQRNEDSACISRPIVLYFFLYNAVDEEPLRISRPAGQSVPSVAGCKLSIGGLEDRRMVGTRNSNLLRSVGWGLACGELVEPYPTNSSVFSACPA
jgi:hypothetical protein